MAMGALRGGVGQLSMFGRRVAPMMHEYNVPARMVGDCGFNNAGERSHHIAPGDDIPRLTFRQFVVSAHHAYKALPNLGGKLHGVVSIRCAFLAVENALAHVSCARDENPESIDDLLRML